GTAAGLSVVDEAQAAAGDGPDVRLARAALYAREPGRVRPIEQLAERIETWPEADQFRLLAGLVEVYDELGDKAAVVRMLKRIAGRRPSDLAVWMRLHERATAAGDTTAAAEARAAVVRIEGESGPSVLLCDAAAASRADQPRIAKQLTAAFGTSPNRADACLALTRVPVDDMQEWVRLAKRAATLEPTGYESVKALLVLS